MPHTTCYVGHCFVGEHDHDHGTALVAELEERIGRTQRDRIQKQNAMQRGREDKGNLYIRRLHEPNKICDQRTHLRGGEHFFDGRVFAQMDILHVNETKRVDRDHLGAGVVRCFQKNDVISLQRPGRRQGAEKPFLKLLEKTILGDRNVDRNQLKRGR